MKKKAKVTLCRVKTYDEALAVALIRNECRHFMTNDTSALDVERQLDFFDGLRKRGNHTVLLILRLGPVPCGYGVIKVTGRTGRVRACLTGGLAKPFRGKGIGRQLFKLMLSTPVFNMGVTPWLEVLRSNERALRLYTKLGFHITKATKDIYTMEYRP